MGKSSRKRNKELDNGQPAKKDKIEEPQSDIESETEADCETEDNLTETKDQLTAKTKEPIPAETTLYESKDHFIAEYEKKVFGLHLLAVSVMGDITTACHGSPSSCIPRFEELKNGVWQMSDLCNKAHSIMTGLAAENATLKNTMRAITESLANRSAPSPQPATTWANIASGKPPKDTTGPPREKTYTALIYHKEENATSKEVSSLLLKHLKPATIDCKAKNIRKIGKGGIAVDFLNQDGPNKLQEHIGQAKKLKSKLEVKQPTLRSPQLIIYGVPNDTTKEDLIPELQNANPDLDWRDAKAIFATKGRASQTSNWVIQTSLETFHKTNSDRRLFLGWRALGTREFLGITRCFKCLRFGHKAINCPEKDQICSSCAKNHHHKDCTVKNLNCPVCVYSNKRHNLNLDTTHEAFDNSCPSYVREIGLIAARTNYG